MNIGKALKMAMMMGLGLMATIPAMKAEGRGHPNYSAAYSSGFEFLGKDLDHTYFCLNPENNGNDCFTIVGWGQNSTKTGGVQVPGTGYTKRDGDRCLARSRASNSLASACGLFSQLYGINGVCHQHTNRGQMSMHGSFMNPGSIRGGWASFAAYGPYGISYPACFAWSHGACLFTFN